MNHVDISLQESGLIPANILQRKLISYISELLTEQGRLVPSAWKFHYLNMDRIYRVSSLETGEEYDFYLKFMPRSNSSGKYEDDAPIHIKEERGKLIVNIG